MEDILRNGIVSAASCGCAHTLVLVGGSLASFGRGEDGQLGHGTVDDCCVPKLISGVPADFWAIGCGAEYSVAIRNGTAYSWGWGDFGRLGHGCVEDSFVPRPITSLVSQGVRVSSVACGDTHTLLLSDTGNVYACGRNQNGQLGLGHTEDSLSPQLIKSLQGQRVTAVCCGAEHSLAATESGQVYSWGWGRYGNLGDGGVTDRLVPYVVTSLQGCMVVGIACGWRHSIIVEKNGAVYTFGWGRYGQLGHGDCRDESFPRRVQQLSGVVIRHIAGGWRHTMAADEGGRLYAWGWNKFGQLGVGRVSDCCSPVVVPTAEGVRHLACGWRHSVAITETGKFLSWGRGTNGQLGSGRFEDLNTPHVVLPLSRGSINLHSPVSYVTSQPGCTVSINGSRYGVVPNKTLAAHSALVPDIEMRLL